MGAPERGFLCRQCFEWHNHALRVLQGELPKGCQECGLSMAGLEEIFHGGEIRMYVVPKDGIYQVLCKVCCDRYIERRKDIWRKTEFGDRLKL